MEFGGTGVKGNMKKDEVESDSKSGGDIGFELTENVLRKGLHDACMDASWGKCESVKVNVGYKEAAA